MNDFSELEAELKQLRPVAPSTSLGSRIERALEEAPAVTATPTAGVLPRPKLRVNWFALGFGAAAAAALLMLARVNVDRPAEQSPGVAATAPASATPDGIAQEGFVPEGLTRVVYNTRDEGLMFPEETTRPVRRVRSRSRETLQWKDASTGASLRVSYPTEEVELIPVSGQ